MEQETNVDKAKVQAHFDRVAERHNDDNAVLDSAMGDDVKFANIYRNYYSKRHIKKFVLPGKDDLILDFGCGVGRITFYLSPLVKRIDGVDVSSSMIQTALNKQALFPNTKFAVLKGLPLSYQAAELDKVISNWVMQHVTDNDAADYFKEFYRILKPGGKFILFEQVKNNHLVTGPVHVFRTADEYRKLLSAAGFKEVTVKPVMRVPARGMSLWNKFKMNSKLLLWGLSVLDEQLIMRKPEFADYYTNVFVFQK